MTIPDTYGPPAATITTFDFTDIASGTGIQEFFLGITNSQDGLSGQRILSDNKFYSDLITEEVENASIDTGTPDVWGKFIDKNYDVTFVRPQNTQGIATVNIAYGSTQNQGSVTAQTNIAVSISKISGGTTTELDNMSGSVLINNVQTEDKFTIAAIPLDLGKTHFKINDILRLNVQYWAQGTSGSTDLFYGQDPNNRATTDKETRDWGDNPSISSVQIPFRIPI